MKEVRGCREFAMGVCASDFLHGVDACIGKELLWGGRRHRV
jgi:hypothetical protein